MNNTKRIINTILAILICITLYTLIYRTPISGDGYTMLINLREIWDFYTHWNSRTGEFIIRLMLLYKRWLSASIVLPVIFLWLMGIYVLARKIQGDKSPITMKAISDDMGSIVLPLLLIFLVPFNVTTLTNVANFGNYLLPSALWLGFAIFIQWGYKENHKYRPWLYTMYIVLTTSTSEIIGLMTIFTLLWVMVYQYRIEKKHWQWRNIGYMAAAVIGFGLSLVGKIMAKITTDVKFTNVYDSIVVNRWSILEKFLLRDLVYMSVVAFLFIIIYLASKSKTKGQRDENKKHLLCIDEARLLKIILIIGLLAITPTISTIVGLKGLRLQTFSATLWFVIIMMQWHRIGKLYPKTYNILKTLGLCLTFLMLLWHIKVNESAYQFRKEVEAYIYQEWEKGRKVIEIPKDASAFDVDDKVMHKHYNYHWKLTPPIEGIRFKGE